MAKLPPMKHQRWAIAACLIALAAPAPLSAQATAPIAEQIQRSIASGAKEFIVPGGTHVIDAAIRLRDVHGFALRGETGAVLQLPPVSFAIAGDAASAGDTRISIARSRAMRPGMRLQIAAPGAIEPFTKKPRPNFIVRLDRAEPTRLLLAEPLPFPVPGSTLIRDDAAPNLIDIRGGGNITIENLTLDGGRGADDPLIQGHAQLCGIFAAGPYSYEKGPTGPPISNLTVGNCTIRNCFGRGIALYAVADALVENCAIENCADEAIDFDHFAVRCIARNNRVSRARIGVELNDANDSTISGNEFTECGMGVNIWRWCRQPRLNVGNLIESNRFSTTAGDAIRLATGTEQNTVRGNTITSPVGHGISVAGNNQIIEGNTISGAKGKPIAIKEGSHVMKNNEPGEPPRTPAP
ncbi:MAG TPA: right-handed parallel beta-helix repeat-containing protein [Verrucomicrobiae bacterium]|nr:right-handed parallel beta-helix repeat-containing protein [Verrucomicrobiae bacterium]